MVSYKLVLSNKNIIEEINLNLKSLEKIDEFTMQFESLDKLRVYLIEKNLINKNFTGEIKIFYKNNKKDKYLKLLYSDDRKYLDKEFLKMKVYQYCSDINFLEKLANHYSIGSAGFNPQGTNVSDIRLYISDVRQIGYTFNSNMLNIALDDLIKKAIYKINSDTYEVKVNYRGLRDLAIFVSNYEKALKLKDEKTKLEQPFKKFEGEQVGLFEMIKKF